MDFNFVRNSVKAKLLLSVSIALVACISGLLIVIISVQENFQQDMVQSTTVLLQKTQSTTSSGLSQVNIDIEKSLSELAIIAAKCLSEKTEAELGKEKEKVAQTYQSILDGNAKTIAKLLAKVAPAYILSYDYISLIGLSKAVSESRDIVFAVFQDKKGKSLTKYLNRKDPVVKRFIKTGQGRRKIDRALDAAKKDKSVFLHTQNIEIEGQFLGKIVLCISKSEVEKKTSEMSNRFKALVFSNREAVGLTLNTESEKVKEKIDSAINILKNEGAKSARATAENISLFNQRITSTTRNLIAAGGFICILFVFLILYLLVAKIISRPLNRAVLFANKIADGDISGDISATGRDEISNMTNALSEMRTNLFAMISAINRGVSTLDSSATDMSDVSGQLTNGLATTSRKSNMVAAAAEEMSSSSHSVAAAVEQASSNTNTVVKNVRNISASLSEMANSARQVKEETNSAVEKVEFSTTQVDKLGESSQEIGSITEIIRSISINTNLLSLNATIEAARAGVAGKGFSVVANEIKTLAMQTSDATDTIDQKLTHTQELAAITVAEIEGISDAIGKIDKSVGDITNAIDQQNEMTSQISDSIGQAAEGLQDVNQNVGQLSIGADQVASEITEVNQLSSQMDNSSAQVLNDAENLKNLALQLKEMVQKFTL